MASNPNGPLAAYQRRLHGRNRWTDVRRAAMACPLVVAAAWGIGCAPGPGAGGLVQQRQEILARKDRCHGSVKALASVDLSGTGRGDDTLTDERLRLVHQLAVRTAACTGHITVDAFSATEGGTVELGSASFSSDGGTENARLNAAVKTIHRLDENVRGALRNAERRVGSTGTAVVPQLVLAKEFGDARPEPRLVVTIATDGIPTIGAIAKPLAHADVSGARRLAAGVAAPDLRGAEVRFLGIGRVAGNGDDQPGPERVAALRAFYEELCRRSRATACRVTTSYVEED